MFYIDPFSDGPTASKTQVVGLRSCSINPEKFHRIRATSINSSWKNPVWRQGMSWKKSKILIKFLLQTPAGHEFECWELVVVLYRWNSWSCMSDVSKILIFPRSVFEVVFPWCPLASDASQNPLSHCLGELGQFSWTSCRESSKEWPKGRTLSRGHRRFCRVHMYEKIPL